MGLLGEVLEVQRVHRALEPDVQLADLPLGHGPQADAQEREVLVQRGDVGQVARQPVQALGDHHIDRAR